MKKKIVIGSNIFCHDCYWWIVSILKKFVTLVNQPTEYRFSSNDNIVCIVPSPEDHVLHHIKTKSCIIPDITKSARWQKNTPARTRQQENAAGPDQADTGRPSNMSSRPMTDQTDPGADFTIIPLSAYN